MTTIMKTLFSPSCSTCDENDFWVPEPPNCCEVTSIQTPRAMALMREVGELKASGYFCFVLSNQIESLRRTM